MRKTISNVVQTTSIKPRTVALALLKIIVTCVFSGFFLFLQILCYKHNDMFQKSKGLHLIYFCTISQSVNSNGGKEDLHFVEKDPRSRPLLYEQNILLISDV